MLLLVTLENTRYIVDVGFGSMSLTGPLILEVNKIQTTPHEDFRIVQDGSYYRVDGLIKAEWQACYKFHLEEHFMADYEMMNWYTSCHPQSHFTYTITAARTFDQGRYTIRDNVFHTHYLDQSSEKTIITGVPEFQEILQNIFGLNLAKLSNLEERLKTLL
jgi:N-hydroxyarylamine O-acetyltransferase